MVDPNEEDALKFVPTGLVNGIKCIKIDKSDVQVEIYY